ncbi:MAG: zf-HC2 domain-containing protein [Vicinamibacterales bacterium]
MTHNHAIETSAAERYLLDEMSEIERFRFEEHFFDCEECAGQMRLGHHLRTHARELFPAAPPRAGHTTSTPPVVVSTSRGISSRVALPWAAAAVLAVGLAYQTLDSGRGRLDGDSLALSPVVLRPASRGALPAVAIPAEGEFAALTFDVQGAAAGRDVAYRITRVDGEEVQAGRLTASPAGMAFVLVPADRLTDGQTYVLTTSGDASEPAAEYRFTARR